VGSAVMLIYCIALVFYLWVRITKTLDLGRYLPYGIFVLIVEIMGATTTLLYGVNILWHPVNPPLPEDPNHPGLPKACSLFTHNPNFVSAFVNNTHAMPAPSVFSLPFFLCMMK
jgi:hypothetical protein